MPTEKQCIKCKRVLPLTEFHKDRGRKDGLHLYCKQCNIANFLRHYHTNPAVADQCKRAAIAFYEKTKTDPEAKERRRGYNRKTSHNFRMKNPQLDKNIAKIRRSNRVSGVENAVWKRAGNRCESCGRHLKKGGLSEYNVHHLDTNRENNSLENLLLVCIRCHLWKFHANDNQKIKAYYASLAMSYR